MYMLGTDYGSITQDNKINILSVRVPQTKGLVVSTTLSLRMLRLR